MFSDVLDNPYKMNGKWPKGVATHRLRTSVLGVSALHSYAHLLLRHNTWQSRKDNCSTRPYMCLHAPTCAYIHLHVQAIFQYFHRLAYILLYPSSERKVAFVVCTFPKRAGRTAVLSMILTLKPKQMHEKDENRLGET